MKKTSILFFILFIGIQLTYAQNPQAKIESFRESVLPRYSVYFASAQLTQSGQLQLIALTDYNLLKANGKNAIMDNLVKSWQESLVIVHYETKRELWGLDSETGKAILISCWDLNPSPITPAAMAASSQTALHPWFFYFGGNEQFDSFKNINLSFSTSVGFFLLMNRWDLAATFSGSMMGNFGTESITTQTISGLQSKVYFPVKKLNISPHIGVELGWTRYNYSDNISTTLTPAFLTGISWHVGRGSIDLGFRIGKQTSTMVGYTFIPGIKTSR